MAWSRRYSRGEPGFRTGRLGSLLPITGQAQEHLRALPIQLCRNVLMAYKLNDFPEPQCEQNQQRQQYQKRKNSGFQREFDDVGANASNPGRWRRQRQPAWPKTNRRGEGVRMADREQAAGVRGSAIGIKADFNTAL